MVVCQLNGFHPVFQVIELLHVEYNNNHFCELPAFVSRHPCVILWWLLSSLSHRMVWPEKWHCKTSV